MQLLSFLWYSAVFMAAGMWVLSKLIPDAAPIPLRRAAGILLVISALGAGYLLTYSLPPAVDCQPGEAHTAC